MADTKQFNFFESYYRSFQNLPPEVVGEVVKAMGSYFFENEIIELNGLSQAVFELIKPVMDSSKKKAENGSKGGAPKGNTNAKKQAKNNQKQANDNQKTSNEQAKTSDKEKDIGDRNKDIGEGIKEIKEKDSPTESRKRKSFTPPTLEEVTAYCQERNNGIDPESFIDFYTAKGWKIGKEPMKDWKASIRTWEKRKQGNITPIASSVSRASPKEDGYEWLARQLKEGGTF